MTVQADLTPLLLVARQLKNASDDIYPKASKAVVKIAHDIHRDAKIMAPVDTGFLKSSITVKTKRKKNYIESRVVVGANYGAYVEYGTSRMAPQPFLNPATDRHIPLLEQALAQLGVEVMR